VVTKKDKYLAAAQKFLERGSLDKALAEFLRAVQEDPKDTRTWLRIAEIHVKRGDNEKATEVYLKTADLYVEQGFFQRAVAVYKNIIKLSPGFVEAYLKLADIYRQLGLLSDAVQQYELAAGVYQKSGRTKEALAAMRQIVDINPEQPVSRIKLAEAASQANLIPEAIQEFQRAAELLRSQGRIDEYLRVAERLVFHQPDDIVLAKEVARQYIDRNNARFALAKLQACFKVDPKDTETLDLLAKAFEQLGQASKTVSVLKELAKVYAETGRSNERMAVYKRIIALDPGDKEARDALSTRASYQPPPSRPAMPVPGPPSRPAMPVPAPARPSPPPERPRLNRDPASITFSEMQVPQFLQQPIPTPPPALDLSPVSTAERVALASGLLEPNEEDAAADVHRIIAESDTFVKYGLTERAVEHLRKVFELVPTHAGAHERLAAVLLQLGRNAEAVLELEALAEQLASSQPAAAADFARRALQVDPTARRARKVLESVSARPSRPAAPARPSHGAIVEEEIEEISSGLIEMDTPQPEIPPFSAVDHRDTDGDAIDGFVEAAGTDSDQVAPNESVSEFARVGSNSSGDPALMADLEQVDFFIAQGLTDDARGLIDDISYKYPPSPLIEERRRQVDALAADALGAVPVESGASVSNAYSGAISPRAMVASGGEMDLASHRDLGIGYKDMGLFDAAINEFTILTQDPSLEVFALGMIGECHESKGALADAVAFYKKALNRPTVTDTEATQLYYQLGSVFQTMGEVNEALYFFEKVLKRDAAFRDVRKRITELRGPAGSGRGTEPSGAYAVTKNRR
jgi:tetratricopeptide (TPR) repeat protein